MRIILGFLALCLFSIAPAMADRISRKAPANKSTIVNNVGTFNTHSCTYGPLPRLKLISKPKHGKVSFKTSILTMKKGKCRGKKINSTLVIYTPSRGFKGKERFKTRFSFPQYGSSPLPRYVDDSYSLIVK